MSWPLSKSEFEEVLDAVCRKLTSVIATSRPTSALQFQDSVKATLEDELRSRGVVSVAIDSKTQQFPDLALVPFGVEVKFTQSDSWRSVANSISESSRTEGIEHIYVVYGKMGGTPDVRWRRYDDCVIHVRTSHRPRFEVDITAQESLFAQWGISYDEFRRLPAEEQMEYIRDYARSRLNKGERLWWLEPENLTDADNAQHALDVGLRLYRNLTEEEKRKLRAEAALLNPDVVRSGSQRGKYDGVAMYLVTYRGVVASQVRDLYSAGSVALKASPTRGGIYVQRSLEDIQQEMIDAAEYLDDALFLEYWGGVVPREERIKEWLRRADALAKDWKPSDVLFRQDDD